MTAHGTLAGIPLRAPPANIVAEQALLGALLANNKAYDRVAGFLRPEHFAEPVHGCVYAAIAARIEAGRIADVVSLRGDFEHSGALGDLGGPAYLAQLLGAMVGIVNAGEYGRLVRECFLRREIIAACEVAVNEAFGGLAADGQEELEARQILDALDGRLTGLSRDGAGQKAVRSSAEVAEAVMAGFARAVARKGGLAGVSTGYRGLDAMTGGWRNGQLITLAGRPAMGKTALSAGIAARGAAWLLREEAGLHEAGKVPPLVYYVSAEMLAEDVQARVVAACAGLPLSVPLRAGMEDAATGSWRALGPADRETQALGDAARRVGQLPIAWDDAAAATVPAMRAKARQLRRRGGLRLIVVDYLGRIRPSDQSRKAANRVYEISELTDALKSLAMELNVPVVLLSQLSRAVEGRDDKTPLLSDLRDSGTIEQDSDMVGFIYREHYYLKQHVPAKRPKESQSDFDLRCAEHSERARCADGQAQVILAKQRQGPTGPVRLRFDDKRTWFFDEGDGPGGTEAVPGLPD